MSTRRNARPIGRAPTRPSYQGREPVQLVEYPPTAQDQRMFINAANGYFRRYSLGECLVVVTKEYGQWHLSIAHPRRYPTWDEIAEARYRLIPDAVTVAMVLPPQSEYINLHPNCFHLHEIKPLDEQFGREGGAV